MKRLIWELRMGIFTWLLLIVAQLLPDTSRATWTWLRLLPHENNPYEREELGK